MADRETQPATPLAGRVAIVTGGTKGIGLAIARRLRAAGASVAVCGRHQPDALPDGIAFFPCDVRDPDAVKTFVEQVAGKFGRLDILVNNAGGSPPSELATSSPRFVDKIIALNLTAPIYMAQAAYPFLMKQGGSIIHIASVSAIRPSPDTTVYAAAKSGLLGMSRSLAHEWGPEIRSNVIIVGYVETENTAATYGSEEAQLAITRNIALQRLARRDEIAEAALFLASPAASYVTGAELAVHGGGERPPFLNIVLEERRKSHKSG